MSETNTKVETITTDDLDNLLGMPGAAVAMTPAPGEEEKIEDPTKPGFFQTKKIDMSVLEPVDPKAPVEPAEPAEPIVITDDMTDEEKEAAAKVAEEALAKAEAEKAEKKEGAETFDDLVDEVEELDEEGNPKAKVGRPTIDKGGMAQLVQALIDDETILPFDEDKKLEDYTVEDYKELLKVNFDQKEQKIKAETPKEFFDALPNELQYAAKYVADGGQDLKGLFKALALSEENKAISTDTEKGQETVARQFLQASNFGTEEEIQEQIDSWKDLEKLESKANQFKPKLDKMQEQVVQRQIQEQEIKKKQQEDASLQYANSIYDTLEDGKLNGLTMSSKVQSMIYQGLVQPNYSSVDGSQTNLFGHLIEKHQFVEPNHSLIAEALWLMADPEGYKAELSKGTKNKAAKETARMLKTEQAQKNTASTAEPKIKGAHSRGKTIARPTEGFFKR